MADSAEFFQTPIPDVSPDRNGAEPSGGRMKCYQMVPAGGSREFKVRLSGKIQLVAQHPHLVTTGKPGAALGPQISYDSLALQEFSFAIKSDSGGAGRTQIIAAKADGTVIGRLVVSVKAERPLTYNIHRLQDIARLVSYWPPKTFGNWKGYAKAALWIRWWPTLIEHMKVAERGSKWRLPASWTPQLSSLQVDS